MLSAPLILLGDVLAGGMIDQLLVRPVVSKSSQSVTEMKHLRSAWNQMSPICLASARMDMLHAFEMAGDAGFGREHAPPRLTRQLRNSVATFDHSVSDLRQLGVVKDDKRSRPPFNDGETCPAEEPAGHVAHSSRSSVRRGDGAASTGRTKCCSGPTGF